MSVIRAFIAIDLPPDIQECVGKISGELKEQLRNLPVRWVPLQNVHLTLKFLGDVSLKNLEVLTELISQVASGYQAFEISVGGIGAYPNIRKPRVIWIGLEGPDELNSLQHGIEVETTRLGYAREERPFSSHLTLSRVSRNANSVEIRQISNLLANYSVGFLGVANVSEVHLLKSELKPGGAIYTHIYSASLIK
ncbi:MAG: RNA 2',3'-cyclic phosphodiesterase [Anaerolineales bacterium]|nr:RNA 2',3'-cyclic phosphodiesterase [Anaerolineales bacterium]